MLWIQAAEMSFFRRVARLSLRDRVRSWVIREEFGVEPLLLYIEMNQLRLLRHLVRMPPGRFGGSLERFGGSGGEGFPSFPVKDTASTDPNTK